MATTVGDFNPNEGWERFNNEAANWDKNPMVHISADHASKAIHQKLTQWSSKSSSTNSTSNAHSNSSAPKYDFTVLEIGCGTGILTLKIAPFVSHVVSVDAAQAMIKVLEGKITTDPSGPQNVTPLSVLLIDPEDKAMPPADKNHKDGPRLKYDLIISHLVMHHIPDLRPLLETMLGCLKPGGHVCLTDFEHFGPEARRFHPKAKLKGVYRDGIHPPTMTELMTEVGFVDVEVQRAWTQQKEVEKFEGQFGADAKGTPGNEGVWMDFPFLTCCGRRP